MILLNHNHADGAVAHADDVQTALGGRRLTSGSISVFANISERKHFAFTCGHSHQNKLFWSGNPQDNVQKSTLRAYQNNLFWCEPSLFRIP